MQNRTTWAALFLGLLLAIPAMASKKELHKQEDIVIYRDPQFHCAFPSVVHRPNGELLVAFRRAPDWQPMGATGYTHTDPNSYLVMTRSKDDGKNWTQPSVFFAHPFGGSQDPCMVQLKDKSLICTSYGWSRVPDPVYAQLKKPFSHHGNFIFMGGYLLRSEDGERWDAPIIPPACPREPNINVFGMSSPAFGRGAMCEGKDGRLYWAVVSTGATKPAHSAVHLMISEDKGRSWKYSCTIAEDSKVTFNETSLYETPDGNLVAFMRTADFNDHGCIARSTDHGRTFQPWQDMGFQGHPFHAVRLSDDRVLLTYGYRHPPYGIRARVLNEECTDFATSKEVVLRDDGGSEDLGYTWGTMLAKNKVLVVYYINHANGTRYIAGSICKME